MNDILSAPLSFIQGCVKSGNVYWTYHVNMRLKERTIPRAWILDSVAEYELIECYPEDKYLPSYLVGSKSGDVIFHILFAVDTEANNVRIMTAYSPDPEQWGNDMKKRRH